jgi:hypothetical protein
MMASLHALLPPSTGGDVFEPDVAVDPLDPRRVAVVATTPSKRLGVGKHIWCWRTEDAGATWSDGPVAQPQFDGIAAADPVAAYGRTPT